MQRTPRETPVSVREARVQCVEGEGSMSDLGFSEHLALRTLDFIVSVASSCFIVRQMHGLPRGTMPPLSLGALRTADCLHYAKWF